MLDTDATVTTGLLPSISDRLPTGFGDPNPDYLDRLAASLDYLALSCCKPALDEASQQAAAEAMAEHKELLIGVAPAAGEQLYGRNCSAVRLLAASPASCCPARSNSVSHWRRDCRTACTACAG
jgi:hypothetical protein